MYVMLADLQQLNFYYLMRFIIISGVHGAFHFSLMSMCKTLELEKMLLKGR